MVWEHWDYRWLRFTWKMEGSGVAGDPSYSTVTGDRVIATSRCNSTRLRRHETFWTQFHSFFFIWMLTVCSREKVLWLTEYWLGDFEQGRTEIIILPSSSSAGKQKANAIWVMHACITISLFWCAALLGFFVLKGFFCSFFHTKCNKINCWPVPLPCKKWLDLWTACVVRW